jgi:hypothetical protein
MATAKQLAARRKFARIMKSGGFKRKSTKKSGPKRRKTTTRRRITKTIKRRSTTKRTMPSRTRRIRRTYSRGSRGIGKSFKTGIIGDVVKGIGAGSLVGIVMSRVAPNSSITPLASAGAGFLTGGLIGGAANLILSGGLSNLGGIFGGGASAPVQEMSV